MKKLRKISKEYYLRQIVACWLVFYMFLGIPAQIAMAAPAPGQLPQGWEVVTGTVGGFDYSTTNELHIMNITNGTIIKWHDGFNIGSAAWTEFQLINAGAAVMNRDVTGNMSEIYGRLTANGRVFIINPAGIVFGGGAVVNVSQLVASSLNLTDADFLNGAPYTFTGGATAGEVRNESPDTITATDGLIALIGKTVTNIGSLRALDGYVVLAAGDTVTISEVGSAVAVEVTLPPLVDTGEYLVDHHGGDGKINAQHVILAAGDVWASAYIKAYSDGGSDAVATVDIDAVGDVEIDGEIMAEADAPGPSDNAIANVTIDAGGNVLVNDDVKAYAKALVAGPGGATAGVDITAGGNVTVTGAGGSTYVAADAEVAGGVDGGAATATVDIDAGGNVTVNDEIKAEADAPGALDNATANVTIDAGGNVFVNDDVKAYANAFGPGGATAGVYITAGGNVTVTGDGDYTYVAADAEVDGSTATATVDIDAGGNVTVEDGYIETDAHTQGYSSSTGGNLTATTTVNADGDVILGNAEDSEYGYIYADAYTGSFSLGGAGNLSATTTVNSGGNVTLDDSDIKADAYTGSPSSGNVGNLTATVDVDAGGDVDVHDQAYIGAEAYTGEGSGTAGNLTATTYVDTGGNVTVHQAQIGAKAYTGWNSSGNDGDISATVDIDAVGDVMVNNMGCYMGSSAEDRAGNSDNVTATTNIEACGDVIVNGYVEARAGVSGVVETPDTAANVTIHAYGDVIVNSEDDDEHDGMIVAEAHRGLNNSAGVTILAVGDVIVNDGSGYIPRITQNNSGGYINSPEEIRANAYNGHTNSAHIGIATRDGDAGDVIVSGQIGAHTGDAWDIWEGKDLIRGENTSTVEICAARDVIVNGGYAKYGLTDNPGQILLESHEGGQITAEAQIGMVMINGGSTNTANVDIYAGRDVIVHGADIEYTEPLPNNNNVLTQGMGGGYDGGQILARTGWSDWSENTSTIGIYAQRDVTINGATITGEPMFEPMLSPIVSGQVLAGAHGDFSKDTAVVVICAQDDVTVDGVVRADAGTGGVGEHQAHIAIAAGDQLGGSSSGSIIADADPDAAVVDASVMFFVTGLGDIVFNGEAYSTTDHGVTQDPPEIEGPVDCPECDFEWIDWTWCEDCEEELFAPVAPLAQFQIPRIEGCPELMLAAAMELGITPETIQVAIGNALALNPTIQPCEACAALVDAAGILRDEDGSRMAAMVQTFNALAPADAPFTPEMATSIAMAFEGAAEGTQYASAMEYIDAFVEYVAVLDAGMVSPVGDSVAFVMEKYGAGVTGSDNANMAAFVATRLEAIGE